MIGRIVIVIFGSVGFLVATGVAYGLEAACDGEDTSCLTAWLWRLTYMLACCLLLRHPHLLEVQ